MNEWGNPKLISGKDDFLIKCDHKKIYKLSPQVFHNNQRTGVT